jgi:hypothetical protein
MIRMHRRPHWRSAWLSVLIPPALALATLTATGPARAAVGQTAAPSVAPLSAVAASTSCGRVPRLDRSDFPSQPRIDNRFYPLVPGMQFVLDGFVVGDDGLQHPHRIETTVTDLTKVIDGVRTIVILDKDFQDGELQEQEIFFVAQDHDGAVWTLGEYPEEYENAKLTGAPSSWLSGVQGARAGIAMLAHPRIGTPTYVQGLAPQVDFLDCATVFQTGQQHVCVPVGCFDNVLVTDEFAPLDPAGGHQRKFYAPGVGVVRVTAAAGVDPETLQLTRAQKLCKGAFAKIREQVVKQDRRGYHVAKDVYGDTPPVKDTLDAKTC